MSNYFKLTCNVTGRDLTVHNDYFQKKIVEDGSEELLRNRYVCKYAKNLLKKGYDIQEIRNMLKLDQTKLPKISKDDMNAITKSLASTIINLDNFSIKKSDPDVEILINNLISQK